MNWTSQNNIVFINLRCRGNKKGHNEMAMKKHTGLCCKGGIPRRAKLTIDTQCIFNLSKNIKQRVKIYPSIQTQSYNYGTRTDNNGRFTRHKKVQDYMLPGKFNKGG
jgi:hypothetical protein